MVTVLTVLIIIVLVIIFFGGFRIVRPFEKGLIEFFGKYTRTVGQGLVWMFPLVYKMYKVNITERMVDVLPQMVITRDKLNAVVDAVVYYKIMDVKKSMYNVDDHEAQLTSLARTTLRSVIGKMSLTEANENRDDINAKVETILDKETDSYGVEVLRVEIQKIEPPEDVQIAMNKVVKAEQEKIAAMDLATAMETKADGERRAEIKRAEGFKQGEILKAEGEAQALVQVANAKAEQIKLVNTSLTKYFKSEAQVYRKIEAAESALKDGTKFVIDSKSNLVNVMSDAAGVMPIPVKKK
jgi:regulator of protease activity HflC (stomatin/prohibitin superfamily)